jgi:hypothetical protein
MAAEADVVYQVTGLCVRDPANFPDVHRAGARRAEKHGGELVGNSYESLEVVEGGWAPARPRFRQQPPEALYSQACAITFDQSDRLFEP